MICTVCTSICLSINGQDSETWTFNSVSYVFWSRACPGCAGKRKHKEDRGVPALHSGLKQDHALEGLPGLGSPHLVGLEGGFEGGHQPDQHIGLEDVFAAKLSQSSVCACKQSYYQRSNKPNDTAVALRMVLVL